MTALERFARQLRLPEVGESGQARLAASRVLVVGVGGLGSPLATYLATAGVGTLGLVDPDVVEASNLHRQPLYGVADLGRPKVEVAAKRLAALAPELVIEQHQAPFAAGNALALVRAFDLVVDGTDSFAARYLVNDACVAGRRPNVFAAVLRFSGQLTVFDAARGPCYRCLFPEPPEPGLVPSCAEAGVLGALPGLLGTLQAIEVLKLLLGVGEPLIGRLLLVDTLALRFRELRVERRPDCLACGVGADPVSLCAAPLQSERGKEGMPADLEVAELARWRAEGRAFDLLDVREPHERARAAISGAHLLPLAELPAREGELPTDRPLVVFCHLGLRSAAAVRWLRSRGYRQVINLAGGIDAWSREIDPSVPRY